MAEVNDAFIAQPAAPPPPVNPLTQISGIASTIGQLQQNKLFPLQQQQMQLANTGAGISNVTAQQAQNAAGIATLRHIVASVPAGPGQAQAVAAAAQRAVAAGLVSPDVAASFIGSSPDFQALAAQSATTADEIEKQVGNTSQINTGADVVTQNVNPFNPDAPPTELAHNTLTLSPSEEASRVGMLGPAGQPETVPQSALVNPDGTPKTNVAGITGPQGQVETALPPGSPEARAAAGAASGVQLAADRLSAAQAQSALVPLNEVNQLLKDTNTGPGTQVTNGWRSFLIAQAPILKSLGIISDPDVLQTAQMDELKKYMVQMANSRASQFGEGTNEKLAVAATGSPNPDMSNLANRDVTRMNIALTRAQQAEVAAFDASGQPPENYSTWAANWARTVDPRAFMLDMLPAADRAKMLSTITTPSAKRAILAGKAAAEQSGIFAESDIPK